MTANCLRMAQVMSTNYKAPHIYIYGKLFISHSEVQIFSSDIRPVKKGSAFMELKSTETPTLNVILTSGGSDQW